MSNTLKLYNTKIEPWKNFKVDDIKDYLDEMETQGYSTGFLEFNNIQFFKHNLETSIKVNDFPTSISNFLRTGYFNYARIVDNDLPISNISRFYYFITNIKWISQFCVEIFLKMDVVNTFVDLLDFSPKTQIIRQHKNRWQSGSDVGLYAPLIDMYSENINPLLFKNKDLTLYDTTSDGDIIQGSYYLIYRSHTDQEDSPIDILLCGDSPIDVDISAVDGYTGEISWKQLDERATQGNCLVIYGGDNNVGCSITFDLWETRARKTTITFEITSSNQAIYLSSRYVAKGVITSLGGFSVSKSYRYKAGVNKEFNNFEFYRVKCARQVFESVQLNALTPTYVDNLHEMSLIHDYVNITGQIAPISDVDRTDPLLLKIIKLPYKPIDFDLNANGKMVVVPAGWIYEDDLTDFPVMLRYEATDTTRAIGTRLTLVAGDDDTYVSPFEIAKNIQISDFGTLVERDSQYETKLLNSEFYKQKFVYDSFDFTYTLEYLDTSDLTAQDLFVDFYVSLTMSSKFMFKQTSFLGFMERDVQDYSGIVYVARNNELPIFNSAYINYIKTGYNYDIKTRNRQVRSNIVGGALSLAGAIASFISSGYTMGIGAVAGTTLATTGIAKIYNAISDTAQADQNIAQKLKTSEMEGLSVAGSDDVDLMTEYTEDNKAKICVYEPSEKMKKCLFDLFYYYGYVAGFQGIPDTNSRMLFNFVQADVVFERKFSGGGIFNPPKEWLDELVLKFREGITYLHPFYYEDENDEEQVLWDFEQQYENWEQNIE